MAHFMPIKECIIMNKEIKEFLEGLKGKRVAFVGMGVANVPCAKWLAENFVV